MSATNNGKSTPVADTVVSITVAPENNDNQDNITQNNRNKRNNRQKSGNRSNRTKHDYIYFKGETVALNGYVFQLHLERKNKSHSQHNGGAISIGLHIIS